MDLNTVHTILFNAHTLFSLALGIWAVVTAARGQGLSGNYWGAIATYAILAVLVLLVGLVMMFTGLRPPRLTLYILYMLWLAGIMPGLFTLLRGRDDRSAAIAFGILAFFNATVSASMAQRMVVGPWLPV